MTIRSVGFLDLRGSHWAEGLSIMKIREKFKKHFGEVKANE